jgi:DNA (cytosine-5)-methyltransferase 1
LNELALFAGVGGGILGGKLLGRRTVCAVEKEPYCREVLLRRQRDGLLDVFPIWDDIKTFDGKPWLGKIDVISAGFPCQPFSVAGKQKGKDDDRNMWPETIRVIREVRPKFAFLENVPGLLTHEYFGTILADLAKGGYNARWCVLGASDVGAPHVRKRVWILAYSNGERFQTDKIEVCRHTKRSKDHTRTWNNRRVDKPGIMRVVDGVAHRPHRLRAIGNGQVPQVAKLAWEILTGGLK